MRPQQRGGAPLRGDPSNKEIIMTMYEVDLVWRGGTYRERIEAMSAERARRAALERYPGATVLRVACVGRG